MEKRKKNITFLQRILCLALSVIMLLGTVLPAHAYSASGSEAISKGDMDIGEAIIVNLVEYAYKLYGPDPESLAESKIEKAIEDRVTMPESFGQLKKVYDCFATSAYAFLDLGQSFWELTKARQEIFHELAAYYRDVMITSANYMEEVYALGVSHRGRQTEIPINDLRNLQSHTKSNMLSNIHRIEETRDEMLFMFSATYRNKIENLAEAAREYYKVVPSAELIYSIARYGSTDGVDHIITILTTEKCWIVSKSTGKNLNVYTNRAAKDLKNGDRISVYEASGDDTQEFRFVKNSDGSYRIRVNDCKKYIDLYNTDSSKIAKVGAKVQVWSKNTEHYKDQCFTFEKENGYYRILLAANPNYCLYVKTDGYLALGKVKAGNDSQLWNIIYED